MRFSRPVAFILVGLGLLAITGLVWHTWDVRSQRQTAVPPARPTDEQSDSAPAALGGYGARPAARVTEPGVPTAAPVVHALRAEPPMRDLADLAVRMGRAEGAVRLTKGGAARAYQLGTSEPFWIHDIQSERYFSITATLEYVTDEAYFWVQHGEPFDRPALERGALAFSEDVIPAVRGMFGTEWSPGVDGDRRLHVLHHENIPGVAGYFSSTDEYTTAVEPRSNEREMFYVNLSTYAPGSFDYEALLAHELQHMIHWYRDRDETVWANEGLSELAALVAEYQTQTGNLFTSQPDTALLEWEPATSANAAHYAASFLFFAYLRAQYGDEVIRAIVDARENGPAGIEAGLEAIGKPRSFDEAFLDWVVANVVDDPDHAGGRYSYRSMAIDRVRPPALPAEGVSATAHQYGTDYYDVTGAVSDGQLELSFTGDPTVGLLAAVPARAGRVWWSNRGDSGDSRLTREFDLSGAARAELAFRLWYDLETNWDYAYFQVSTDGGERWTRLSTARTTDADPNGNNFGAGLTGQSGGWVEEALDLSPFVGGPVRVRFEAVTDDAVSLAGVAVDDIQLRTASAAGESAAFEAAFTDDGESDAGWEAEGWLRVDPQLPERWALQVIVHGDDVLTIHRQPVMPDGTARVTLDDIPGDASVTVAISPLTPATRNPAGYRLEMGY